MPFRGTAFALLPVHLPTSKLKKENLGWLPFPAERSLSWELFVEVNVSLPSCSVIFI